MFETMLVVDDVEMERNMFRELLEDEFTIIEAENGIECLEVVEACSGNIDIVLLDLVMPEMDGFEVLEKRKELEYFKNVPVIVLTASDENMDQVKAFQLGADDFISKPILIDIVKLRINNVLAGKRRVRSLLKDKEELKVRSELDQMTGLYNKATTEWLIKSILKEKPESQHAFMIVDIDNFKRVNDESGHQEGDHVIKIIADLLAGCFRKSDVIGRVGGDEFVVFLSDIAIKSVARQKASDLVKLMKYKPNLSIPSNVSLSLGLAFSEKQISYEELFKRADEALYRAKSEGKARYVEYGVEAIKIEADERNAVVLCSRNRSICSITENIFLQKMNFVETVDIKEMKSSLKKIKAKVKLLCIDVSEEIDSGEQIWAEVNGDTIFSEIPILVFCRESDMEQYRYALQNQHVKDILSIPMTSEALSRRVKNILGGKENE